jgi:hypothetical protein
MVGPTAGKHDSGLVLPLVVITFLIIGSALMATTTKSWLNLTGTIRQGQARSARAAAESGITELIASLNSSYAHLLIVDSDKWMIHLCSQECAQTQSMEFLLQKKF